MCIRDRNALAASLLGAIRLDRDALDVAGVGDGDDHVPVSYTHLDVYKRQVLSNINEIAPVLPQMLGDGGSRTYLLMAQQNAELRATGGLPGSCLLYTSTLFYKPLLMQEITS